MYTSTGGRKLKTYKDRDSFGTSHPYTATTILQGHHTISHCLYPKLTYKDTHYNSGHVLVLYMILESTYVSVDE